MQKIFVTLMVTIMAMTLLGPISAEDISDVLNSTNVTNSSTNDSVSGNNSTDNSSIANNSTSNNTTSIPDQFKTLIDPQSKLIALITTIVTLKTTYANNSTASGLLNSLSQFEKQANSLNNQITAFMQNSTVENGTVIAPGRINSFIKREAALEHKVQVLSKQSAKKAAKTSKVNNSNKSQTKQNKGNNK